MSYINEDVDWGDEAIQYLNSLEGTIRCEINGGHDSGCCSLFHNNEELDREDICDYILDKLYIYRFNDPPSIHYDLVWNKEDCSFSGDGSESNTEQVELEININVYVPKFIKGPITIGYHEDKLIIYNNLLSVIPTINFKEIEKEIKKQFNLYDDFYIWDEIILENPDEENDYFYIWHGFSLWGSYNNEEAKEVYIKLN